MKLASFNDFRVGVVDGTVVHDVTGGLPGFLDALPHQRINYLIANWADLALAIADYRLAPRFELSTVTLLPPNPAPQHVFAAPTNYRKHIGELGDRAVAQAGRSAREQGFFLMAPGSLVGAGNTIFLPRCSGRRFDHESELAVVIGRAGRNIPRADALNHVFGYSCLIDATLRIERGRFEEERTMRKSFETFNPMGPWIVTADEVPHPQALANRLWVNGELRQSANTSQMIVSVAELIELISSVLPLQPGDVIATGTPEGVGPIAPGDKIRIEIEAVGSMALSVRERAEPWGL